MGQELAKKATRSFKKMWDREQRALKDGDLLTLFPELPRLVVNADLDDDVRIIEGATVHLRCEGAGIVVDHDLKRIGAILKPPPQLLAQIAKGETMFTGTVIAVHEAAGLFEVAVS